MYGNPFVHRGIKAKANVRSYQQAADFLGDRYSRKLAANTEVGNTADGGIGVMLYHTLIVTYYPNGTFSVKNGGWATPTTSARLNQFGPEGWRFWHQRGKLVAYKMSDGSGHATGPDKRLPIGCNENDILS